MDLNIDRLTLKNFDSSQQNENYVVGFIELKIPNPFEDWIIDHAHLVTEIILAVKIRLDVMNIFFCSLVRDFLLDVSFVI